MALLDAHLNTLGKVSLCLVTVFAPTRGPWQRLLEMVRDQCPKVENLSIEHCDAVHSSGGTYTSRRIRFEEPDGRLSSGRQVVDNVHPLCDRLIRELREAD